MKYQSLQKLNTIYLYKYKHKILIDITFIVKPNISFKHIQCVKTL